MDQYGFVSLLLCLSEELKHKIITLSDLNVDIRQRGLHFDIRKQSKEN